MLNQLLNFGLEEKKESKMNQYKFLNDIGKIQYDIVIEKGFTHIKKEDWDDDYKIPTKLLQISTEISEAFKEFNKNDKKAFGEEMADIILRTVSFCHGLDIDIHDEVISKIEKNKNRKIKHGGKRI